MAMMDSTSWNPQDQTLPSDHNDDFQQFLDMGGMGSLGDGLQFDFPDFQNANAANMIHHGGRDQMDTTMGGTDASLAMSRNHPNVQAQMGMTTAASHPTIPAQMIPHPSTPIDAIVEIDAQIQYLQQQRMQQQQRQMQEQQVAYYANQNHAIPPTPRSLEIPPSNNQFFQSDDQSQRQQAIYDRYQRLKEQQDMSFTPLVSPAVTPLDPQFTVGTGFTVPGAYFSPLTSPALHAQSDPNSVYDQRALGSTNMSPAEMELETTGVQTPVADLSKKARKNNAAKARGKGNVRQSPISKPQRRKTAATPKMVSQVLSEMEEVNAQLELPTTGSLPAPLCSEDSEENASVSPETLSDMPPPPVPQHRGSSISPYIPPQNQQPAAAFPTVTQGKPSPATPASLMKLPPSGTNGSASSTNVEPGGATENIETFELPESANFPKVQLSPLIIQMPVQSPSDPGSARASSFQPLPSPVFAKPTAAASATQSPQLTPGSAGSQARKTPLLSARGSKKRSSVNSVHVSPALRPKISPNIKPLLPGSAGISAEDTASRLLTSKSNYQNILEGNTVPGVSYPSELSTNLTSKRTSHKIAEQGRRNRINTALQEIATLLPASVMNELKNSESDNGDKKDPKSGSTPNSKASTVEMAIEYIKQLKQEVAEATKRAEEAEKQLELKEAS